MVDREHRIFRANPAINLLYLNGNRKRGPFLRIPQGSNRIFPLCADTITLEKSPFGDERLSLIHSKLNASAGDNDFLTRYQRKLIGYFGWLIFNEDNFRISNSSYFRK